MNGPETKRTGWQQNDNRQSPSADQNGAVMKYVRFMLFVAAVLAFSAAAYAQQPYVRASVPFNFMVGDKLYPAGDYSIVKIAQGSPVLQISNHSDSHSTLVLTTTCSVPANKAGQTKLVFERIAGKYFLQQIWTERSDAGRQLRRIGPKETTLAQNGAAPEQVVVAAILVQR
jgi:hypothetical protein